MRTIYTACTKADRPGVAGSRWICWDGDTIHISGFKEHEQYLKTLGLNNPGIDYEIKPLENRAIALILRGEIPPGY